ncbi:hypothetical protein XELAEV_18013585mg [Xenopus laevis]|uniref:Uncharacterized protein n=1 Tax=Xenopus laevis TaxID=8355 RepID=A0A974HZ58_XENLA|nr:hypothetical protein XELAEV_18013585mg [Xenopus laevis]
MVARVFWTPTTRFGKWKLDNPRYSNYNTIGYNNGLQPNLKVAIHIDIHSFRRFCQTSGSLPDVAILSFFFSFKTVQQGPTPEGSKERGVTDKQRVRGEPGKVTRFRTLHVFPHYISHTFLPITVMHKAPYMYPKWLAYELLLR